MRRNTQAAEKKREREGGIWSIGVILMIPTPLLACFSFVLGIFEGGRKYLGWGLVGFYVAG